ncbi:MAG: hypothetical protein H6Q89_3079 [Myxococcaceae bacterium]|nr:hypothetical protein [Myxococcaceae bacterium]
MDNEVFKDAALTLELSEELAAIRVAWSGRSTAREPGKFIVRVLMQAMELSTVHRKPLELDFQRIDYMNSSTITPIIRLLDQAKRAASKVSVIYNKNLKWQELNFTALQVFQTSDGRIEVRGV